MGRSSVFWELYTALTDHIDFLACTNESFLNVILLIQVTACVVSPILYRSMSPLSRDLADKH